MENVEMHPPKLSVQLLGIFSFFFLSSCLTINSQEAEMNIYKQRGLKLRKQIVEKNNLTSGELFFCVFLPPEEILSDSPFILKNNLGDSKIKTVILSIKTRRDLDISPLLNFQKDFNSLFLEIENTKLDNKELLPVILTLKELSTSTLKSIPENEKVEYLGLNKIETDISEFLHKFKSLTSLSLINYSQKIELKKIDSPNLKFFHIRKGKFQNIFIDPNIGLEVLSLDRFPLKNLMFLKDLEVKELRINDSNIIDFSPISLIPNLKKLYITNCNLNDLDFLKGKKIEFLDIHNTPMAKKPLPQWLDVQEVIKEAPKKEKSPKRKLFL